MYWCAHYTFHIGKQYQIFQNIFHLRYRLVFSYTYTYPGIYHLFTDNILIASWFVWVIHQSNVIFVFLYNSFHMHDLLLPFSERDFFFLRLPAYDQSRAYLCKNKVWASASYFYIRIMDPTKIDNPLVDEFYNLLHIYSFIEWLFIFTF